MFEPKSGMLELTRKENPVMWVESPLVARADREATTRLLFDALEVGNAAAGWDGGGVCLCARGALLSSFDAATASSGTAGAQDT
jgi:hypothetical protein